ncbi:VPA1262 family protein [Paenalcaligenes hermetiae]|uniref:VPA1262 family protein n=2 Tax=Paenalcaligenes hermetiae TaxID=1157987 RepID=A0ABP9M3F1_9BURK
MLSLATHTTNPHFARLFAAAEKPCAIQLWVLIAGSQSEKIVKRVVYGRVVPYSFDSDSWIFSKNDKTQTIEGERVKLGRLNLFTSSQKTKEFFEHFCTGKTLDEISQQLNLTADDFFNKNFGDLALNPAELVFQPAEYLFNKSAYEHNALHSPYESAGAISSSIAQSNKLNLFAETPNQNNSLLAYIAEKLKEDTGLDFLGYDKERLGNIEFLVFPSLDDKERAKLEVNHQREEQAIKVELAEERQTNVSYQFLIKLFNLEKLIYSTLQTASYCEAKQTYVTDFQLDAITNEIYDCIEVEIYLNKKGKSFELQDRWRMSYIREISMNMHLIGTEQQPVKMDWLEKKILPKYSARAQAVLTPNKSKPETTTIGGRDKEPWVALNRELSEKFKLLKPQASKGKFFLRYGVSQGEGALEFLEWFQKLFSKYQNHHIAIFDPYFEALGLSLLKLYGTRKGNYSVFTSYPTEKDEKGREQTRFNTLLQLCEQNQKSLSELNLTIYGLKQGELHDRYVLVLNNESIPVQGFHLSNSLQSATINHPLLITPIPQDVLLAVSAYIQEIIQESNSKENTNAGTKILFDSQQPVAESKKIHQQTKKPEDNDPLSNLSPKGIVNWINTETEQNSFAAEWLKVATSLANTSSISFSKLKELPSRFLNQLESFLIQATQQTETEHEEISTIAPSFYTTKLDELLNLDIELSLRHSYNKANSLTWAEYYAIIILWQHRPKVLFDLITTAGKKNLTDDFKIDASNAKFYTLLGQALSAMQLSVILNPTNKQAQLLLNNDNAVLQWFGLNMLSQLVVKANNPQLFFTAIQDFPKNEQITFFGWLVLQLRAQENQSALRETINKLFELLPNALSEKDVKHLLNAMRGRLKNLSNNGTWINEKVLQPLLEQERIDINDLAEIWFSDLKQKLPLCKKTSLAAFNNKYEGALTNLAAYFYAHSSAAMQRELEKEIATLHKTIQRTVQQPLASTANYKKWSGALSTALWLEAFVNLAKHYQIQHQGKATLGLEQLKSELNETTQLKSQIEWQQYPNALWNFYYQTQQQLAETTA